MQEDLLSMEAMLLSRAYLYTAFHKAFGASPSQELLEELSSPVAVDMVDEYAPADETMAHLRDYLVGLRGSLDPSFLWNVEAEYTRLFVGPGALPAISWESPYISGEASMFQRETLAVRVLYRRAGLEPARLHHVPDDHVALMCAFMAHQAALTLEAFRSGDWEGLHELAMTQCAFVRDHMDNWLPKFASGACKMKTAHLYPQLARGIAAFVKLDMTLNAEVAVWSKERLADDSLPPAASGMFASADAALERLRSIRLFGLEEYELAPARLP